MAPVPVHSRWQSTAAASRLLWLLAMLLIAMNYESMKLCLLPKFGRKILTFLLTAVLHIPAHSYTYIAVIGTQLKPLLTKPDRYPTKCQGLLILAPGVDLK